MNIVERRKLKRSADLKVLFFTFVGAFLLFFTAFTYFLPAVTPNVDVPALNEDQVFNSITSHDFRGKLDPRLHNLELQEQGVVTTENQDQQGEDVADASANSTDETVNTNADQDTGIQEARDMNENEQVNAEAIAEPGKSNQGVPGVPPRPKPISYGETANAAPVPAVFEAKVVVGDFTNTSDAQMVSDALLNFNFEPVIKQRGGDYTLQVGSFSDAERAKALVQELRSHNFDAKIIYE
jgi:cell division septation protein DedD